MHGLANRLNFNEYKNCLRAILNMWIPGPFLEILGQNQMILMWLISRLVTATVEGTEHWADHQRTAAGW